jgi:hypothetical protein
MGASALGDMLIEMTVPSNIEVLLFGVRRQSAAATALWIAPFLGDDPKRCRAPLATALQISLYEA